MHETEPSRTALASDSRALRDLSLWPRAVRDYSPRA
jgi:hypothetical protein